ncbi:MAG: TolC family protein, partial [Acidobacteria bacterium]|nr:TolC family protein [Acidobacteriota bacterium]
LLPRPGVSVIGENLSIGGPTAFNRLYEVGVTVTQPFELGGRGTRRKEVAERTVALAESRLANVMQRRLLDLRRGYYEAVLARANLEIARENRANFEELVRMNTVRLKEGDVAEVDLIRVRLEKVKFDSGVAAASLTYEQAKVRLLELLGESNYARAGTLDLRDQLEFAPFSLDSARLREAALANRAEVKMAEADQALAKAILGLEESRGKGEITPFAGYKRVGPDNTLLAGVTIPLPFGNRNQPGIARASAQRQVAATNLQLVRNRVLAEVEAAYLAYETARDQVRVYESGLLDQAQESATITLAAYREGVTPLINLIDAQRTRAEVRGNYLKALFDYWNSLFTLEQVTGTEIKK